jgi:hypothetical protein
MSALAAAASDQLHELERQHELERHEALRRAEWEMRHRNKMMGPQGNQGPNHGMGNMMGGGPRSGSSVAADSIPLRRKPVDCSRSCSSVDGSAVPRPRSTSRVKATCSILFPPRNLKPTCILRFHLERSPIRHISCHRIVTTKSVTFDPAQQVGR